MLEPAAGFRAWGWLCAQKPSLGSLLQEAGCGSSLPLEKAGLLGEDSSCPALLREAAPVLAFLLWPSFTWWETHTPWLYVGQLLSIPPLLESWFWSDG